MPGAPGTSTSISFATTRSTPLCRRDGNSREEFLDWVKAEAEDFSLIRSIDQKTRVTVICETAGMAPQLRRVADEYGIRVIASGGFDSITSKYELAKMIASEDQPTEFLHIGDHDTGGTHMFRVLVEDVNASAPEIGGREAVFTRLAVTPEQIERYRLPTAPKNPKDKRAFEGMTCQAEALAPDVMNTILRRAIEQRIDKAQLRRVIEQERRDRDELITKIDALG